MNTHMKAKQNNLIQSADGNFGTAYTYRGESGQKIEQFLVKDFFDAVKTRLTPADTIRVMEMTNGKVTASILLVVLSRGPEPKMELDIRPYDSDKILRYTESKDEQVDPPEDLENIVYISGTGQVERNKEGVYQVKCDGKVIYETEKKGLAQAIARGDTPIPQK